MVKEKPRHDMTPDGVSLKLLLHGAQCFAITESEVIQLKSPYKTQKKDFTMNVSIH